MFTFRGKLSQVPPVTKDYNVTLPPLRITSPPHDATVYNKLTGDSKMVARERKQKKCLLK
jgi:hypothetical protein